MTKAVILDRISMAKRESEELPTEGIYFTLDILGICYLIYSRPNWYGVREIPSDFVHVWPLLARAPAKVHQEPPEYHEVEDGSMAMGIEYAFSM